MAVISILATFAFMLGLAFATLAASLATRERAWRSVAIFSLFGLACAIGMGKAMDATERAYAETIEGVRR
jgi:hypothetical protein